MSYDERDATLAGNVRRIRLFRDLSQEEVARRMGEVHRDWRQSTISRVESGKRSLKVPELLDLAKILEVVPDVLYADRLEVVKGGQP
jgi:transcriptional regulator with XRE-family HTH domain